MNWPILPILVPFAATSALAWAALWLVDRLCERSGPKFDPVAWVARDLGRVISEEFDRRCVHGAEPSGIPPSGPARVDQGVIVIGGREFSVEEYSLDIERLDLGEPYSREPTAGVNYPSAIGTATLAFAGPDIAMLLAADSADFRLRGVDDSICFSASIKDLKFSVCPFRCKLHFNSGGRPIVSLDSPEGPSQADCSNRDAANRDAAYAAYLARPGMSYGEWRAIRYLEPDQSEAVCPNEYDVSRSYRSMGIMTRNEVRESMGLPHLEDVRREKPEWLRR